MIAHKGREGKRGKLKMSKNIERLYKEVKCRDCSVVVTRMDFAKILGKFTKVKIQYESSSSPKSNKNIDAYTHNVNARLKNNENVELSLLELLPNINRSILPSEEWCIDYLPNPDEPKDDKVYDRIAAELEDLMYNEKPEAKAEVIENKVDEFPSIMDILNDNSTETLPETKESSTLDNLQSSDVEAMLLGKVNDGKIMEVNNTDINKIIEDVTQFNSVDKAVEEENVIVNSHSLSLLDEALQKGIEEHLPNNIDSKDTSMLDGSLKENDNSENEDKPEIETNVNQENVTNSNDEQSTENCPAVGPENGIIVAPTPKFEDISHVVFKKIIDGKCQKSVTCLRNLKYSIEFEEKSIEFLGAPKYISSLEDLQVLLQIVNETSLQSLYVLY
ncbi:hypothetical protein KGM_207870 [Danaus plexippus plexippus]|uniref:Uncharacterized protein n=1 Tax=Danaus plexippus plexippus TaxID=278856 RepID=A0A212EMX7_DANPL|nr:hypothetical protein KGM_207870 [Danaus plexippus plexippus]